MEATKDRITRLQTTQITLESKRGRLDQCINELVQSRDQLDDEVAQRDLEMAQLRAMGAKKGKVQTCWDP